MALTGKVSFNLRLVGGSGTGYADFRGGGKMILGKRKALR